MEIQFEDSSVAIEYIDLLFVGHNVGYVDPISFEVGLVE